MRDPRDYDDKQLELQLMEVTQDPAYTRPTIVNSDSVIIGARASNEEIARVPGDILVPKLH